MRRFCSSVTSVTKNKARSSKSTIKKQPIRIVDFASHKLTPMPRSSQRATASQSSKILDMRTGQTFEEIEEKAGHLTFGVNLGTSCTPFSVLQSPSDDKWGKYIYFSQYVIDALADAQNINDFSGKPPDVYCTIRNPFNGTSVSHIGRFNSAAETTDCPMFIHDVLQPIYGGSDVRQMAYGTLFQFEITGVKPDGGWTITDQALERLSMHKTACVPSMIVPVTTPGNEILFGLPYLRKFGLILDCNTNKVDVSKDEWTLNDHYGPFPEDIEEFVVDA